MAEEFVIKSQAIEDKVNQLLPSQGGFQAGVDFSASTMVVPVVDLTETAEGGTTRQDLQSALSLTSITSFNISNGTSTIINTTGYFRIFGVANGFGSGTQKIELTDGTTTKEIIRFVSQTDAEIQTLFDFLVFVAAGDSVVVDSDAGTTRITGCSRQIADINGNLVNPL